MAATPTDQTRQFDYDPGKGLGPLDSLAAPAAGAVSARLAVNTRAIASGDATPTNNAPVAYAHRDAYKEQNETASILGPGAPVVLSAAAPTGTSPTASVVLSWTAPTAAGYVATGYRVEKSVKAAGVFGPWIAGVPPAPAGTAVTVTETGLSTGDIRFRVFTVSGNRESGPSNVITVTVP